MTNYEAIKRMTMEQLEIFLDNVYLTGMNNALYLSRLTEDEAADFRYETYDHPWLISEAEEATEYVFDDDGDTYMPFYLVKAIYRNAGIDMEDLELRLAEPEDDESEEYELWDDAICELEDYIDQIEEAIEEME